MARPVGIRTARTYERDMRHLARLRTAIVIDRRANQSAVHHIDYLLSCLADLTRNITAQESA